MSSVSRHRRRRKIRRTGRHTTPSQAEKVAQKAGKAAPAIAVVGALATGPQVHEFAQAARTTAVEQVVDAHLDAAIFPAHSAGEAQLAAQTGHAGRTYTVRAGDTLSGIAQRLYGHAGRWHWLYEANRSKIHNPNLIYVGQVLSVPHGPPTSLTSHHSGYKPRHSKHSSHHGSGHKPHSGGSRSAGGTRLSGTLGCHGLEALWRSAGGAPWAEVTAASIAMAESGGRQYATGAAGERGYWQIHPVNGALSTYNAYGNARAAVIMSHDGRSWSPWTTYTSGIYRGRC